MISTDRAVPHKNVSPGIQGQWRATHDLLDRANHIRVLGYLLPEEIRLFWVHQYRGHPSAALVRANMPLKLTVGRLRLPPAA